MPFSILSCIEDGPAPICSGVGLNTVNGSKSFGKKIISSLLLLPGEGGGGGALKRGKFSLLNNLICGPYQVLAWLCWLGGVSSRLPALISSLFEYFSGQLIVFFDMLYYYIACCVLHCVLYRIFFPKRHSWMNPALDQPSQPLTIVL